MKRKIEQQNVGFAKEISELEKEIQIEIDKHKWIKSELAEKDLNGEAVNEWMELHFPSWLKWKKLQILSEI